MVIAGRPTLLCILLVIVHSTGGATSWLCPVNCTCVTANENRSLSVNCNERYSQNSTLMLAEIDQLLDNAETAKLTELEITHSPLNEVPASICKLTTLKVLKLDVNEIKLLPDGCFSSMSHLAILSITRNELERLQDGLFDGMQSLTDLLLNTNNIQSIGLHVFSNASDLNNLKYIDLDFNPFTELDPWPIIRLMSVNRSAEVNLSNNRMSFTNRINWKFHCHPNTRYKVLDLSFTNMNHVTNILSGWNMTLSDLLCLVNYRYNDSTDVSFRINANQATVHCDCVDFDYYRVFSWMSAFSFNKADIFGPFMKCTDPMEFRGRYPLQIPLNEFTCNIPDCCPAGCTCIYTPAMIKLSVSCDSIDMFSLPAELPSLPRSYVKFSIQISNSVQLHRIERRKYLESTAHLELTDSGLVDVDDISTWELLFRMETLHIDGNCLESIPERVSQLNVTPTSLNLGRNPWRCSCNSSWMNSWLNSIRDRLLGDVLCHWPERLRGKSILTLLPDEFCEDPVSSAVEKMLIKTLLPLCVALIVVLVVFSVVYRLRVRLFIKYKFHPFDRDDCVGEEMDYDVFVSSSSSDDDIVIARQLVDSLESRGYAVCYHERDFQPGESINNNICRAIERSKRTICLISESFLNSSFCIYEFEMALHHNVTTLNKKRLIALMTLASPVTTIQVHSSDSLRQFIRQYTYINHADNEWFDRLLYALPVEGMMTRHEETAPLLGGAQ